MIGQNYIQVLDRYRALVAAQDGIAIKGKKTPYTAMNGNMFSFLDPDGVLCLRLGKDDKAAYEVAYSTGDVMQYGAVMRGYVPVIAAVLDDDAELRAWFDKSVANARSLKPKPTKRT